LLDETQLPQVAQELRDFIIDIVQKKVILAQA
jgi:deoxyxylulose-5-phosphate synthase